MTTHSPPAPAAPARLSGLGQLLGGYFMSAGILMFVWLVVPHASGGNRMAVTVAAAGMLVVGAFLVLRFGDRLSALGTNVALGTATALISVVYYESGRPGGIFILLFVWGAPFGFALLKRRDALVQVLLAAIGLAVVVELRPQVLQGQRPETTVVGVASLAAISLMVERLIRVLLASREERDRLEAQVRQSQRLESLGQLAGGVAHDFNNLLAVIGSYAEFVASEVEGRTREDVTQIQVAAERASRLTHQLLAFARKEVVHPAVIAPNTMVSEVEQLLRRSLGEQVELLTKLAPDLASVLIDRGQFEQVLINLAVNARDAMAHGGRLTIDTANADIDRAYAEQRADLKPGRYVRLRVTDTGSGMDEETLSHVFEPFFTTKPVGSGTGLGLATTHGIIVQAGGHISIYSELGRGTTVSILLPASDQTPEATPQPARPEGAEQATILLAEDEASLREVARRVLASQGYDVLLAGNGVEALELASNYDGRIDLLLTDAIMPQMSGRDLAEQLRIARPGIKVVYMSGYAQPVLGDDRNENDLIEKPFTAASLLNGVNGALHSTVAERPRQVDAR